MNLTETSKRDAVGVWSWVPMYADDGKFGIPDSIGAENNPCATAVFRFRARFPGVWPLHCHHTGHVTWGNMALTIVVDGFDAPSDDELICGQQANFRQTTTPAETTEPVTTLAAAVGSSSTTCEDKDWELNSIALMFLILWVISIIAIV